MPRSKRRISSSNIYHIMIRGNERKNIFKDKEDKMRFISTLYEKKKNAEYFLYAYCLMDNHAHLLIKENKDSITRIMKRINTSYAYYFNKKYKRVGHVFQDRFKSEGIETDYYLLAAIRYIHNNPVKARITTVEEYRWSSYKAYTEKGKTRVDVEDILEIFTTIKEKARAKFIEFSKEKEKEKETFLEYEEETEQIDIDKLLSEKGMSKESISNRNERTEIIKELKETTSLSIREIADLLGIDRNIVQRTK